ncbi:MAG: XRE family transcriptional regulator [Gammaproteobacteria bacterium]|nr:XRE family transcriptional regulator [Gammaproteobacteria bacterium]
MAKNKTRTISPIGTQLKALRRKNNWTLSFVSKRTNISIGTLSKLENGQTSLNFTSVNKLAEGLALPVTALTSPQASATGRRTITRAGSGAIFQTPDSDYEILCNDLLEKNRAYLKGVIKKHSAKEIKHFRSHDGQEFLYVLAGTLELHTEFYEPVVLKTGDSIMFDSSMGHKYVSKSKKDAVILVSMSLIGYRDVTDSLNSMVD